MKWKTQHGNEIEISEMTDSHARNSINMLIKNLSPQEILEMICEANEARKQALKKRKSERRFSGLKGEMAQEYLRMCQDEDEFGHLNPFDGL